MTINNFESNPLLPDDEIDLKEVMAAFRRRWIWVASGGLIGLGIAPEFQYQGLLKSPQRQLE